MISGTKKCLEQLREVAGEGYSIQMIDYEMCLYRDYGDFEVECSGFNNNRKKAKGVIFIWDKRVGLFTTASIEDIRRNDVPDTLKLIDKVIPVLRKKAPDHEAPYNRAELIEMMKQEC